MFLAAEDNTKAIEELIANSQQTDCAVAFLGLKAENILLKNKRKSKIRLICNLDSGGTNPNAVKALKKRGIKVKKHPSLHAKVYLGDSEGIISSANLSANGLGLEGEGLNGWLEAGYIVRGSQELTRMKSWFGTLWNDAAIITEEDIKKAQKMWEKRRKNRPALIPGRRF